MKTGQASNKAKEVFSLDASFKKRDPKRTADSLDEPRDWKVFNRNVFVTKGEGFLRENVQVQKTGEVKDVFSILGTCADNQVLVLQVWGTNAKIISNLFKNVAKPDFAPTLWFIPFSTVKGLCFREVSPNNYQRSSFGATFAFSLEYGKGEAGPFSNALSKEAYPSPFAWDDGNFAMNGDRIPHYRAWGQAPGPVTDEDTAPVDYIPPMRTYDDASPEKPRRVVGQQTSSSSKSRPQASTDLSFEEEDEENGKEEK